MRIIAGEAKGRRLQSPPGLLTRPTADRVREAMFSVLLPYLCGARVLDAFAGSGALGLEAVSRGANSALMIEQNQAALKALRHNVASCNLPGSQIRAGDTLRVLRGLNEKFDIIFLDPPYNQGLLHQAIGPILERDLLATEGLIVVESTAKNCEFICPPGLENFKYSVYGDTALYYCRKADELPK